MKWRSRKLWRANNRCSSQDSLMLISRQLFHQLMNRVKTLVRPLERTLITKTEMLAILDQSNNCQSMQATTSSADLPNPNEFKVVTVIMAFSKHTWILRWARRRKTQGQHASALVIKDISLKVVVPKIISRGKLIPRAIQIQIWTRYNFSRSIKEIFLQREL